MKKMFMGLLFIMFSIHAFAETADGYRNSESITALPKGTKIVFKSALNVKPGGTTAEFIDSFCGMHLKDSQVAGPNGLILDAPISITTGPVKCQIGMTTSQDFLCTIPVISSNKNSIGDIECYIYAPDLGDERCIGPSCPVQIYFKDFTIGLFGFSLGNGNILTMPPPAHE